MHPGAARRVRVIADEREGFRFVGRVRPSQAWRNILTVAGVAFGNRLSVFEGDACKLQVHGVISLKRCDVNVEWLTRVHLQETAATSLPSRRERKNPFSAFERRRGFFDFDSSGPSGFQTPFGNQISQTIAKCKSSI